MSCLKGKHKIQGHWQHTIYEVIEQPFSKIPVFKIKSMEGEDIGVKIVHRNLLLPLFSDPFDQTGELVNNNSPVDPKETMSTQVAVVVSAFVSHVHNLSTYERAQVTNMFQRGTRLCYSTVSETLRSIGSSQSRSIYQIDMDLESYRCMFN